MKDYKSLEKTVYLIQREANAKRLNRPIRQLEASLGKQKELIEE
jgi:PHD/YefM family antitoxin component YafN of YafNO toxin-antitoxin module